MNEDIKRINMELLRKGRKTIIKFTKVLIELSGI
jgi:hypothetical protein